PIFRQIDQIDHIDQMLSNIDAWLSLCTLRLDPDPPSFSVVLNKYVLQLPKHKTDQRISIFIFSETTAQH
ncbi:2619_t:CDS:2, partial [Dentiscutata heterogama]